MPRGPLNFLVHYLGKLGGTAVGSKPTDADLLGRFVVEKDEAAFAALVERHGQLVWSVCRRVLPHQEDAEDAFQATLLVLARKASAIRNHRSVASFLYGVAHRTALKTRTTAARRRKYESLAAELNAPPCPTSEAALRELQHMLDEEVQRLPEKLRAPFVLCCLEGKGKAEAAEELGCPEGTVSGRVAHARQRLQERLRQRGIALSTALCSLAVAEGSASAITTAAVVRAALMFAAGKGLAPGAVPAQGAVSSQAVTVAEAVLHAEAGGRLKLVLAVAVLLGLAGSGAGAWLHQANPDMAKELAAAPEASPVPAGAGDTDRPKETAEAMVQGAMPAAAGADDKGESPVTLAGRVLDPDGRPLPGARVAVAGWRKQQPGKLDLDGRFAQDTLGTGNANDTGEFQLTLTKAALHNSFNLIASCPGYGLAWSLIRNPSQANVPLQLVPGQSVRGRLADAQGKPARGVTLHVSGVMTQGGPNLLQFPEPPEGLTAWFPPMVTDEQGSFSLLDLGPNWTVYLSVRDDRFASQILTVKTGKQPPAEPLAFSLVSAQFLEGQVTAEDAGAPLAGVTIEASGFGPGLAVLERTRTRTDVQGRFRLNPHPTSSLSVTIHPPEGAGYLGLHLTLPWPPKQQGEKKNFTLPRGVRVRGQVVEAGSKKPLAGAVVRSWGRVSGNPYYSRPNSKEIFKDDYEVVSGPDGVYEMTLKPGPGHLLIKGPTPDYLHVETTDMQLMHGQPGGNAYYPDGLLPVDFKPGSGPHALESVVLRRGVTIAGRLVGPDGSPANPGFLLCPTCIPRGQFTSGMPLPTPAGGFELPGCDPDRSVTAWFYEPQNGLGAVEQLSVRGASDRVVRLAACGSMTVRVLPQAGTKLPGTIRAELALVLPPHDQGGTDVLLPASVIRGSAQAKKNPQNTLTFTQLIPGASYFLRVDAGHGWVELKKFTVKPGESLNLGDVIFQQPGLPAKN